MPKEKMGHPCITCVIIDSVMRMDKKNHPPVYLEKWKYRIQKIQMSRFTTAKLESESESESKSGTELMAKLKYDSDSE